MRETVYAQPIGYQLVEYLGEGLNSCVYRAIRESSEFGVRQCVAVKILKSDTLVELWRNEIERLQSVRSNHCVRFLAWEIIHGRPALVLEFVDGVTLEELSVCARLKRDDLAEIISQAQLGLRDLHAQGLFHGDLNLYNIMIDQAGMVKLVDFGLFDSTGVYTTPKFASPRVIQGALPDLSDDLYSLAQVVFELERRSQTAVGIDPRSSALRSCSESRERLGDLVKRALQLKHDRTGRTKRLAGEAAGPARILRLERLLGVALVTLLSFVCMGDHRDEGIKPSALISVRTRDWVEIKLRGASWTFAPTDQIVEASKEIQLIWRSARGSGEESLTLREGNHIVLDDAFFVKKGGNVVKRSHEPSQ